MGADGGSGQVNSTDYISFNASPIDHNDNHKKKKKNALVFTYGTLKRGFSNHVLLQDMISSGDAAYLGICRSAERLPLVCGPYRVPFLLNIQGFGDHVWGELYSVSPGALARMDELEGISRGHYERLPIRLIQEDASASDGLIWAEAYYAHRSYADDLWKRNMEIGYSCYSKEEAKGYIRRKDRPQHLSFLEQIRIFVSSTSNISSQQQQQEEEESSED
ncbi:hypothetical protein M9H77_11573 [Catharanthus roseus]|uniref:Uncharacterized protein n=1 Tax=Catharanthus roseus TaxID=4058 RepID=A0ACC0BEW6_CATRO|nr:hypothetical protein M9H77_11573 [Catharanthus roseus]